MKITAIREKGFAGKPFAGKQSAVKRDLAVKRGPRMSSKGQVFHWIIYGIAISLLLFLLWFSQAQAEAIVKGQWQRDFFHRNYLEAEQQLASLRLIAREAEQQAAQQLAGLGGFLPGMPSPCGRWQELNLWNARRSFCFPPVAENLKALVAARLDNFQVGAEDGFLYAASEPANASSAYAKYTYTPAFRILSSISEYAQMQDEAVSLRDACAGAPAAEGSSLKECLDLNKAPGWEYGPCFRRGYLEEEVKVAFCVVRTHPYTLALDFS